MQENKVENEKKPSRKKTIISILIVLLITAVVFIILFNFNDIHETVALIKTVDGKYMGLAVLFLVLYALTWPLSLVVIAKTNRFKTHFLDNYLVGASEHFFNSITPFSTGGQPVQIYLFTQKKIKASDSTGIIVANFIALMIASNAFAIASLVYYGRFSENFTGGTVWMIGLGFAMNLFTLTFMILMATCKFIRDWFKRILEFFCRNKFIGKHLKKFIPVFDNYCENAQSAAKEIFSHKFTFVIAVLVKGISLLFYYAIPYFILKSLDVDLAFVQLPFIILASAFAITTMVWVPTPGGTGGIEFAFTTIFTTFAGVTSAIGLTGMILWRALTYYLLMIISLLSYIIFEISVKRSRKLAVAGEVPLMEASEDFSLQSEEEERKDDSCTTECK